VGSPEDGLSANEDVTQHLILLRSGEDKDQELVQLFRLVLPMVQHLILLRSGEDKDQELVQLFRLVLSMVSSTSSSSAQGRTRTRKDRTRQDRTGQDKTLRYGTFYRCCGSESGPAWIRMIWLSWIRIKEHGNRQKTWFLTYYLL
jgi:hypothetical protein